MLKTWRIIHEKVPCVAHFLLDVYDLFSSQLLYGRQLHDFTVLPKTREIFAGIREGNRARLAEAITLGKAHERREFSILKTDQHLVTGTRNSYPIPPHCVLLYTSMAYSRCQPGCIRSLRAVFLSTCIPSYITKAYSRYQLGCIRSLRVLCSLVRVLLPISYV